MRGSVLLFLLCALAWPPLHHCRPFLFMAAPNILRADTEETIVIQGHEFQKEAEVMITVYDFYKKSRQLFTNTTTLKAPDYLSTLTIKIPFADVKPRFPGEKQYLLVEAIPKSQEIVGTLEKVIMVSLQRGFIYIQIDKSIYTPSQTVHYRIFVTDQQMNPVSRMVAVELQNPSGVTVMQEFWQVNDGLFSKSTDIPVHASFGEWKIVARCNDDAEQKYVTEFEVKEYVLPTFEVQLTSNKYFHVTNEELNVDITARYLHNEDVQGYALALFAIIHGSNKTNIQNSWQRVNIENGEGSLKLTKQQLIDEFKDINAILGTSIFVNVRVFSTGGDVVQAEKSGIRIVDSPYKIQFIKTPSYFKPGLPFPFSVIVTNPDESPAENIDVSGGEHSTRTNIDGIASLTVNSGGDSKQMAITVSTTARGTEKSQPATASMIVTAYNTWRNTGNFLHIQVAKDIQGLLVSLITRHAGNLDSTMAIKYFTILMVGKGGLFRVKRQAYEARAIITTLHIDETPQMWPSFRLVAYYYLNHGPQVEIVSDSVWVDMPDVCVGTLELKKKETSSEYYSPGSYYNLQLIADEGAKVGLVAVDKAVYALNRKNKLSQKKVWAAVEKTDIGCTFGSGKDNMKVFEDAGLDIATSVGTATVARRELNCPRPPSRKRRAVKNVDLKTAKEDEYPEELKECCRAGFLENPMGLSCEQRKVHVRRKEECKKAFVDCCSYAQKLPQEKKEELIWSKGSDEDSWDDEDVDDDNNDDGVTIRTSFPESWNWRVITIKGSPTGARVTMPLDGNLPDSITTWEMMAISIRKDKGICVSKPLELVVKKKLFVDLKLPYSVVKNEQVEIKAVVYNHLDESQQGTVFFRYNEKLCSVGSKSKSYSVKVKVPRQSTLAVPYVVIPLEIGNIPIEVQARFKGGSDGIQKFLNVLAEGQTIRKSRSILLDPQGKLQEEIIKAGRFDDRAPSTEPENSISVQGDILGESLLGTFDSSDLRNLITLPTGCPEQTFFSTTPNVILTKYLDDTRQWDQIGVERRNEALTNIVNGHNRQMMTWRSVDGSLSGSTWLTAYVVKIYAMANDLMAIKSDSLCQSVEWLLQQQSMDGSFLAKNQRTYGTAYQANEDPKSEAKESLTAFVLIALTKTEVICKQSVQGLRVGMEKAMTYLEGRLFALRKAYSAVISSYALALMGSQQANDVIDNFRFDETYWPFNNDHQSLYTVEATAYGLLQKIQLKRYGETHKTAEWLIAQRTYGGGYKSTQATALALEALAQYKKNAQRGDQLHLNVTLEISGRANPKIWIINDGNSYVAKSDKVPADKEIKVKVSGSGKGTLTVMTVYQALLSDKAKECKAFTLEASLESVAKAVKHGVEATFKLTIRARYLGEEDASMTIIDIRMLSTFLPEENDLKQLQNKVENYISLYETHSMASNDSVIIYLETVSRTRDTVISFQVHQTLNADLLQPAAVTIYEYYDPDKKCTTFYNLPKESGRLQKLCQESVCKCAQEGCAVLKDVTEKITITDLDNEACGSGVDYAYKVKLTKIDQFDCDMQHRHSMSILDVIKSGTDTSVAQPGSTRTFFSHLACQDKLKLEVNKQYLIIGLADDMWQLEKDSWAYLLGRKTYMIRWPEEQEIQAGGFEDLVKTLQEFSTTLQANGCQT